MNTTEREFIESKYLHLKDRSSDYVMEITLGDLEIWLKEYALNGGSDLMTTHKMVQLVIAKERGEYSNDIRQLTNLQNATEVFSNRHFNKIQESSNKEKSRGLSFLNETNGFKILTYQFMGRIMVSITDGTTIVSLVGSEEGAPHAGLHSMTGSINKALQMLDYFTDNWGEVLLKVDENITLV